MTEPSNYRKRILSIPDLPRFSPVRYVIRQRMRLVAVEIRPHLWLVRPGNTETGTSTTRKTVVCTGFGPRTDETCCELLAMPTIERLLYY